MEANPLVSVIIPVYNVAPYLNETLDSVVSQSYENLEIIIVDDGSNDGSGEICDEYAARDKRIRLVHQENRGVSAARNVALDLATGDYYTFLDSDDAYEPDFVRSLLTALRGNEVEIAVCKYTQHYTTGKIVRKETDEVFPPIAAGVYNRIEAMHALAANTIHLFLWNKLYVKRVWDNVRFPEGVIYEDIEITFRVFYNCTKVCVIGQPLYCYRKRPGSITDDKAVKSIKEWIAACDCIEAFIVSHTPELYSKEHLILLKESRLRKSISYYVKYMPDKESGLKEFKKDLRKQIIALKKEVGLRCCSVPMKISYWIIRVCPGTLRIISPLYWKLKGKRKDD